MRNCDNTNLLTALDVMEIDGKPLTGMRICITGHLSRTRKEIARLIKEGGGSFDSSVKFGTTHLLTNADWSAGSVNGVSSKFAAAKRWDVKVIDEDSFIALLGSVL